MYRVRTVIAGAQGGAELSTMFFNVTGGLTAANANAAVGAFWLAAAGAMSSSYSATTEGEVAEIDIATGNVTGLVAVTPITHTGTSAAYRLPPATQGLIRWRTGTYVGGREIRGRTFIPGLTQDDNTSGVPSSGMLSGLQTAANNLISDPLTDFVVYSRKNRDAAPVISGTPWAEFAVLRSRRD